MIKKTKGMKRHISFIITFIMVFSMIPWQNMKVEAYDADQYYVESVTLFKIYDRNRNPEQVRVLITGNYLKDAEVGIITSTGYTRFQNRTVNSDGLLQFDIQQNQVGKKLRVGSIEIDLNEEKMPTLTGVNRKVKFRSDDLSIQGTNLTNIKEEANITAGYEHKGAYTSIDSSVFDDNSTVSFKPTLGSLGLQHIIFEKTEEKEYPFTSGNRKVEVNIKYTYKDQFSFIEDIKVEGLNMRPNRGEKGDTIYFEAKFNQGAATNLQEYDVFFLKSILGEDLYTNDKKGTDRKFQQNINGKSILTVKVPQGLSTGEYYVVLTNVVSDGKDPMEEIVQEKIIGKIVDGKLVPEMFTIIDSNIKSKIINVQPNQGPDTGSKTTISGQFLGTLNIPEFTPTDATIQIKTLPTQVTPTELKLSYGTEKEGIVGWYNKGKENEEKIKSAQRIIKVIIGDSAVFLTKEEGEEAVFDVKFNKDLDRIIVQTPQVSDAEENPKKDVVIETTTVFTTESGRNIEIKERAQYKEKYTFIPSKVTPSITGVTPDKIQVIGSLSNYETPEDRIIAIYGSNFMIHRYVKPNGTEVIRYPIIEFGNEIILNKNAAASPSDPSSNPNIQIKVLDAKGKELDGTEGNEIGTKILVTIPKGETITNLGKTFVKVTNPMRNSETLGLSAEKTDFIEFVNPDVSKNPIITTVVPDTVSVDGGEEVIITGTNFANEVKVFIDGEMVTPITRRGDGKEIKLKAPKGREGNTQIQVMNPEGGMATRLFTYVKTFTNPKITDFSPKKGNTGTLVIIKGDNFLKPEPTASEDQIFRLIGTRVLLGNEEINQYYKDPITKRIKLQSYRPDHKIIYIKDKSLKTREDIYSILLEVEGSSPKRFYTLDTNAKGEMILSDGAANTYKIQLSEEKDKIVANKDGGKVHPLKVENHFITIEKPDPSDSFKEVKLIFQTPYKMDEESKNIIGNNVRIVSRNEIYFKVPILNAPGFYDLTIINPDTKKDSKIGKNGFEYFTMPDLNPDIISIDPREGSVEGGYTIKIKGKDFENDDDNKARVYINGVEVKKEDTIVSLDGTEIKVKVPKYEGDLREEKNTDRLTVPVVVVNPVDGGSASEEKGFTYVVPSSKPQITKVIPQSGTAAGGNIVEITGVDFRFYEPYDDKNRNQIFDPEEETFTDLNGNGIWDDLLNEDLGLDPKVLPKVFFGENKGEIIEFSRGYLKVIAPPGKAGKTDLYVLNNDAGVSGKAAYTYVSSNPKIDEMIPSTGSKLGGDKVEMMGSGFAATKMDIYKDGLDAEGNTLYETKNMPQIRFSDISNKEIPRDKENSGRIDKNRTTVNLPGELTIEYNGVEKKINISIKEKDQTFQKEIVGYDNTVKFIPVSLLTDGSNFYKGSELIRLEVLDRRLIVERGYARETELVSQSQIKVNTPSYHTIGKVSTVIINPDGGKGETEFDYKNPDSRPRIEHITKEKQNPKPEKVNGKDALVLKMTYKGGNIVTIEGEDFREEAQVQISNLATITKDRITYDLSSKPQKLTFEMPNVGEEALNKFHRVVVTNKDGASAYSDGLIPPIYIVFTKGETQPIITKLSPMEGPAEGGTKVKIEGDNFRKVMEEDFPGEKLAVFFGEEKVKDEDMEFKDYKTIYVKAPKSSIAGKIDVKVENPDGELAVLREAFYYISSPIIENINPGKIFANDKETEITMKGKMFMPGAKVIIGGKIINLKDVKNENINGEGINKVDADGNNVHVAVVDGKEAASVIVENETTIKVKFDEILDLKNTSIIIINPDKGISNPYNGFQYEIPVPNKPIVLEAIPGYESSVKLLWADSERNVLNKADRYEIYGKLKDDKDYAFIGDTKDLEFLVKNLTPNTSYSFMVRAMNRYGSALEFAKVDVRTFTRSEDSKLNEKEEIIKKEKERFDKEGKEEIIEGVFIKTIGTKQISIASDPYVIDLSLSKYKNNNKVTIAMPIDLVQSLNRKITVTDGTFSFTFLPRDFYTREVAKISAKDIKDAYVLLHMKKLSGRELEFVQTSIPRNQRAASNGYEIGFSLKAGRNTSSIDKILRPGTLTLNHSKTKYPLVNTNTLFIGKYEPSKDQFSKIGIKTSFKIQDPGIYMLLSDR